MNARELAAETLAHSLADDGQREMLADVFESVARRIELLVPDPEVQNRYGRTLLGIDKSLKIDAWVKLKDFSLWATSLDSEVFDLIWPLLIEMSSEKRLTDTTPELAIRALADAWLLGESYSKLLSLLTTQDASYPYGNKRRRFDIDQVVGLCKGVFGFEFTLIISAIKEAYLYIYDEEISDDFSAKADLLQKRLKYGLPDAQCIAYFEAGYSDRVVAQILSAEVWWERAITVRDVRSFERKYPEDFGSVLRDFPSYFFELFKN